MPYTAPSVETFKARFPEFASVSDSLIQLMLNEAFDQIGDLWYDRDRAQAQMLLTAHNLIMEGEPGRTSGEVITASGPLKSRRAGDTEEVFAGTSTFGATDSGDGYEATTYGRRYVALMRLNFPAICAV